MPKVAKINRQGPTIAIGPGEEKYKSKGNAADRLPFCPVCRKCWEYSRYFDQHTLKQPTLLKYSLPGYGKKRKVCPKCEEGDDV